MPCPTVNVDGNQTYASMGNKNLLLEREASVPAIFQMQLWQI